MAVESIGAVAQTSPLVNLQNAGLGQDDFLKILLTELKFQDPLKAQDNKEFIAQLAQFSGLELNRQSNDKADALLTFQSATQAVGLIGKQVQVRTTGSDTPVGTVTTVTFQNGSPLLQIKVDENTVLQDVSLSQIFLVR
jgi:flagellar basal-body rod modification protein FlgD